MRIPNGLPTTHPGEFLREALDELELTQAAFSRAIGVSAMRISHLIKGKRRVTADLALRFARAFGQSPEYWLNLQAAHDLKTAARAIRGRLKQLRVLRRA